MKQQRHHHHQSKVALMKMSTTMSRLEKSLDRGKVLLQEEKLFEFQLAHLSESECQRFSNNECGKLYCNASFHLLNWNLYAG